MRNPAIAMFLLAAALLSGCARSRITTEIKSDGTWARTVALTGQVKSEGGMDMGGAIDDTFVPPAGEAWKSSETKKGAERTLVIERKLAAGESLKGDLSIKGEGPGKLSLVSCL